MFLYLIRCKKCPIGQLNVRNHQYKIVSLTHSNALIMPYGRSMLEHAMRTNLLSLYHDGTKLLHTERSNACTAEVIALTNNSMFLSRSHLENF